MKKEFINYMILGKSNETPLIEIIKADPKDENSEEVGFRISGVATTFDQRNENGGIFKSGDFDKFIRDYFKRNKLNMVCPIEHSYEFDNRGIFAVIENELETLNVTVEFYKDCCSLYEVIKNQVKRGILQGFSTYGWIMDDGNAELLNISLVSMPSDRGAKIFKNTKFIGFEENEPEQEIELIEII